MIAELVSAVKRALSRMLLIIVAMGFGTVKPRLGDSLGKVVAIGVVYTILAVLDGIIRARNVSQYRNVLDSYVYMFMIEKGRGALDGEMNKEREDERGRVERKGMREGGREREREREKEREDSKK